MLQSMREMSKSWIFKSLMILLVVSFGIWGVGDMFHTHPGQRVVAKVGRAEIRAQELDFRFQVLLPEMRKQLGEELTIAEAKKLGLLDHALGLMIEELSFEQETARLGLNLDDAALLLDISKMPELLDEKGRFDQRRWEMVVNKSGLTERFFLNEKKRTLLRLALFAALTANVEPPQTVIDLLYQARGMGRILEIVSLRNEEQRNVPAPSEDEMKAVYEAHEEAFTAPEYRGFTVARLNAAEITKNMDVSEDDIQKAYDSRREEWTQPEQRDLIQLVFADEDKARAFHGSLKNAASFEATAKGQKYTLVPLDKIDEKSILPELYASVFSIGEGDVSEPIKSDLGWHIVKVKKIREGGLPPLAQIKDDIRARLRDERAGDLIAREVNRLDDSLAAGTSLEEIADSLKLRLLRFAASDTQGNGPDGREIKDIPNKPEVLRAAFEQSAGESSPVFDDGTGNYLVVRTDKVEPSRLLPFETVKDEVRSAARAQKQEKAARETAEGIANDLRKGERATKFASLSGAEVRLSKPVSQISGKDDAIPASAMPAVFKMKKGDVITAEWAGKQYVLRLADLAPVDPQKPGAGRIKITDELEQTLRNDFLEHYAKHLHKLFPRSVKADVLNSLKN